MAISVSVPKDLKAIKTKEIGPFTKRQAICFSIAGIVGFSAYFFTKGILGTDAATLFTMIVAFPFFFFAMFERDGFPAEKLLYFRIRQIFLVPGIRPYKSENIYTQLEKREKLKREVEQLEKREKRSRKISNIRN